MPQMREGGCGTKAGKGKKKKEQMRASATKRTAILAIVTTWALAVIVTIAWALSDRSDRTILLQIPTPEPSRFPSPSSPPSPSPILQRSPFPSTPPPELLDSEEVEAKEWLKKWGERRGDGKEPEQRCEGKCAIPRHLLPRQAPPSPQMIPRKIWQTWKSDVVGPHQFSAMASFIRANPEYEYFLFDDDDCWEFVCRFGDDDIREAYETVRPGAAKADIWRLLVIWHFGGIYLDTDARSVTPFARIIGPNSSVVSGMGRRHDFHQWILAYTPKHPIIGQALQMVTLSVRKAVASGKWVRVVDLTGPEMFHHQAVKPILRRNGCTTNKTEAQEQPALQLVREGVPCNNTDFPERIGVIQIFDRDFLGGNIIFKVFDVDFEKQRDGAKNYETYTGFNDLFDINATGTCKKLAREGGWLSE